MDFTSLSPQQVLDLAKPCKEFSEALQNFQRPELDWSDEAKVLSTLRQYTNLAEKSDQKQADVEEETMQATARDGALLPLKVYRTAQTPGNLHTEISSSPLIVLYFGGGFVLGNPTSLAPLARVLVKQFKAVVVLPTYRLAPEHPFPTGVNDGWDALSWIAENASGPLRSDPAQGFVVGGVSAGGNIVNIITHIARDTNLQPPITGVWLCCSAVRLAPKDAERLPEKYRLRNLSRTQDECIDNPVLSSRMNKMFKDALKPDYESKLFAPMIWQTEPGHDSLGHERFPKTYSQVCGIDAARDESLIFDDILKNEGTPTRLDMYAGLPHAFFHSFKNLPQSKEWEKDTMEGFAWLLKT